MSLRWRAPAACPDADAVRRRVVELAGAEPSAVLDAEATVTEASGFFHVALKVRVGAWTGERALTADSCDALAESVAVILAMSRTSAAAVVREPAIPPKPTALPAPVLRAPAPLPLPDRAPSSVRWVRVAALGELDVGTLPVPTYGGGASVALAPSRSWAFALGAAAWAHQDGFVSGSSGPGAHFGLLSADATGCYSLLRARAWEISPCALVEIDRMTADGRGALLNGSATATWVALGAGARLRWEIARAVALTLEADAVVPTEGQTFTISAAGQVYSLGVAALRTKFGPEVRF